MGEADLDTLRTYFLGLDFFPAVFLLLFILPAHYEHIV